MLCSVFGWPLLLTLFANDLPCRFGDRYAYVTVDAHIYSLSEAIVNKIESAKADRTVGKLREVRDAFGGGHTRFCYPPTPSAVQGKILLNSAISRAY